MKVENVAKCYGDVDEEQKAHKKLKAQQRQKLENENSPPPPAHGAGWQRGAPGACMCVAIAYK